MATSSDPLRTDPLGAVLDVLRRGAGALTVVEIKKALEHGGAPRPVVDDVWSRVQKRLRPSGFVQVEGAGSRLTYRFVEPAVPTPGEAFEALLRGGLPAPARAAHADLVRAALRRSLLDPEEAERRRIERVDGLRALAELAMEVEELVVINEASAAALVHRVRGRAKRSALEPVARAGERTTYDRTHHKPVGAPIADGARVVVVRPGYVWKSADGDVLITAPVVEQTD